MSFLKSVDAARARLRENANSCDTRDIATPGTTPRADTVAMSQKSQRVSAGDVEAMRWRELFERYAAVRQYEKSLSRSEAEAVALNDVVQQWLSENPIPASPPMLRVKPKNLVETIAALKASGRSPCYHCGLPNPCTPILAGAPGEHAWIHSECWAPMNEKRQREALDAVTRILNAAKISP
jgi:hypothetical protein